MCNTCGNILGPPLSERKQRRTSRRNQSQLKNLTQMRQSLPYKGTNKVGPRTNYASTARRMFARSHWSLKSWLKMIKVFPISKLAVGLNGPYVETDTAFPATHGVSRECNPTDSTGTQVYWTVPHSRDLLRGISRHRQRRRVQSRHASKTTEGGSTGRKCAVCVNVTHASPTTNVRSPRQGQFSLPTGQRPSESYARACLQNWTHLITS